jgi:amidase
MMIANMCCTDGGPEEYENAPVGLQIMGRRLEEEKITAIMQLVSDLIVADH